MEHGVGQVSWVEHGVAWFSIAKVRTHTHTHTHTHTQKLEHTYSHTHTHTTHTHKLGHAHTHSQIPLTSRYITTETEAFSLVMSTVSVAVDTRGPPAQSHFLLGVQTTSSLSALRRIQMDR